MTIDSGPVAARAHARPAALPRKRDLTMIIYLQLNLMPMNTPNTLIFLDYILTRKLSIWLLYSKWWAIIWIPQKFSILATHAQKVTTLTIQTEYMSRLCIVHVWLVILMKDIISGAHLKDGMDLCIAWYRSQVYPLFGRKKIVKRCLHVWALACPWFFPIRWFVLGLCV